ncbi:MAG TPA: hypothetical protein VMR52_12620 [Dehalococcoidia bacterium]|nr:hypothetical protein [Dehalococcoidia bacterium]
MTTMLKERGFAAGYGLMLVGVVVLLIGFAIDAWLHADDETLASREGLFTLSNPGHALIFAGLAITIVGACLGPYTRWVLGRSSAVLTVGAPVGALLVAGFASLTFATALNDLSHDDEHSHAATVADTQHDDAAAPHDDPATGGIGSITDHSSHNMDRVLPEHRATVALSESTMHEPPNSQPVTAENLAFAETFLAEVRAGTEKYKDVAVAQAEGYIRITPDIPLIGAHFFKPGLTGLDPAQPAILLYTGGGAEGWDLIGVSFTLDKTLGDETLPETPLGGLAGWHYHTNLCFTEGGNVSIAEDSSKCFGVFAEETGWLLHVWAWSDSPEGVFAHANSLLQ